MDIISIFLIAVGLSMDAFAVSISNGILLKKVTLKDALKTGFIFGGFQAIMPIIGWFAGITFSKFITNLDHWIAFILLAFIGGNMIYEALKEDNTQDKPKSPDSNKILLLMAIATSIDALAVGVSFAMIEIYILNPALIIGIITFILSALGVFIGKKAGKFFKKKSEIFGGIILIMIGLKILYEHLFIV